MESGYDRRGCAPVAHSMQMMVTTAHVPRRAQERDEPVDDVKHLLVRNAGTSNDECYPVIAAQAVALGYAIVTDNPSTPLGTGEQEFARIDDLPRENCCAKPDGALDVRPVRPHDRAPVDEESLEVTLLGTGWRRSSCRRKSRIRNTV